uniref:Putative secreted protein n=1 Tax=Ixodes ricinus TaxID=34613 RepID=A0A6B0TR76_IXORI
MGSPRSIFVSCVIAVLPSVTGIFRREKRPFLRDRMHPPGMCDNERQRRGAARPRLDRLIGTATTGGCR